MSNLDTEREEKIEASLGEFATHLETAQTLWRRFPRLVESRQMPETLRAALVNRDGHEPDYEIDYGDKYLVENGLLKRTKPTVETEPDIITSAKTEGDRIAAKLLIEYTVSAFESYLDRAPATEISFLNRLFSFTESGPLSLIETFLHEVGMELPKQEHPETDSSCNEE